MTLRGFEVAGMPWVVDSHIISFPPPVLKGIIVGCQMPEDARQQLRDLASRRTEPLELKKMVRLEDRYALRIEPL